ncbi:MAG TPA: SRPBCC family protein [Rugosimonospora sp.]|nr:SRPBCC family protein [Rugosimonospora sp.]
MSIRILATRLDARCPGGSLETAQEFVEACLAETSPGAYVDPTRLGHGTASRHPVLRAVPRFWWTWLVQLLLPNQGPALTSFVTVEEALVVLSAAMLMHALGTAETGGTQGNARIEARTATALLAWSLPATPSGSPRRSSAASGTEEESAMSTVQRSVEVAVPVHAAFEQLSRFESYPRFMTGVREVIQVSDTTTHWVMDLGDQRLEFNARITECAEDKRLAWQAMDGPQLCESITLRPLSASRTQITADLEADAQALMPGDPNASESLRKRLAADLDQFKDYMEYNAGIYNT